MLFQTQNLGELHVFLAQKLFSKLILVCIFSSFWPNFMLSSSKFVPKANSNLVESHGFPGQKMFLKQILVWMSCLSRTVE